jgi:NADH-quinone oxidoreductase subunit N
MLGNFQPHLVEYLRFLPEILLSLFGIAIMMLEAVAPPESTRRTIGAISVVGVIAAFVANLWAFSDHGSAFQNMIVNDAYGTFFRGLVLVVGLLCILTSFSYLAREGAQSGEYYALILFSLVGQCILSTASDLIMVFIGLEISSIATYILAGFLRDDRRNNESALKYFLLGSFATAFLLYGVAWIYGLVGSTNLDEIRQVLDRSQHIPILVSLATALLFVGLAFKVSIAPFQVWAPDVYQGAPAPVSAFLSAGPKAAAFAVFFRVFMTSFHSMSDRWIPLVWGCALLTMVIGNFAALLQDNVKRMLGYSSIAHAGYVLIALTASSQIGMAAAMFYLASYALMNIGAFAVISHVAARNERFVKIEDFDGLGRREPMIAGLLAIFIFSLIGVPLTAGFFGKFYVFQAALNSHLVWLTVIGLINSAIAAYYYLKIIVAVYMREPGAAVAKLPPVSPGLRIALWASALGVLVLGIFPSSLLSFASLSAAAFR